MPWNSMSMVESFCLAWWSRTPSSPRRDRICRASSAKRTPPAPPPARVATLTGDVAGSAAAAGAISVIAPLAESGDESSALAPLAGTAVHVVPCAGLLDSEPGNRARAAREHGIALALSAGYGTVDAGLL